MNDIASGVANWIRTSRQSYRAGEKLFVDYAGQTIPAMDSLSGKTKEAYLFVATLGASNYTFAMVSFLRIYPHGSAPMCALWIISGLFRR